MALETEILSATATSEPSILSVFLLGLGTVFVGLICLIFIIKIYSLIVRSTSQKKQGEAAQEMQSPATAVAPVENRGELIAAVSAAVATVMGKNAQAIRILSFKKVG
ncbi:MAG: OadG family protein [Clostridia bacterium]|nr:OadG family protein [Clostridia bacterium]